MSWIFSLSRYLDLTRKKILFIVDGSLGPKWASTLFVTEVKSNHLVCDSKVYTAQICDTELEVWTKKLCTVAHQCWEIEKEKLFGCFLGLKACCSLKDIQTACIEHPRYWGCHKDKEEQGTQKLKRCLLPGCANRAHPFSFARTASLEKCRYVKCNWTNNFASSLNCQTQNGENGVKFPKF